MEASGGPRQRRKPMERMSAPTESTTQGSAQFARDSRRARFFWLGGSQGKGMIKPALKVTPCSWIRNVAAEYISAAW